MEQEKRSEMASGIDILLSMQRRFQEEHGFDFWKLPEEKRRDMFIRTLFAAISELAEAGDEVNKWWKKGSREPEALMLKKAKILEEMIDCLHFFIASLLMLGADGKEVADAYMRKMAVNFERQKKGELGYV